MTIIMWWHRRGYMLWHIRVARLRHIGVANYGLKEQGGEEGDLCTSIELYMPSDGT